MKNVSLGNDQCWPGWLGVAIFLNIINVIYVKLCMAARLIELYLFIPLSVTMTIFQGHRSVKQF